MNINIKTKNIELSANLRQHIEKKLLHLVKFLKNLAEDEDYFNVAHGKERPKINTWVEIEKTTLHHKKGEIFLAKCKMIFPKKSVMAQSSAENIITAITEARDELQKQLKDYKEKSISKRKRQARVFKKDFHLSQDARMKRKGRILEEGL